MEELLLTNIYKTVTDELLVMGLTAVNKPSFCRTPITDCFKIRMGSIIRMVHDFKTHGITIDLEKEVTQLVAKEISNEFGDIIFDLGADNEETITNRKYQIDKILGSVSDSIFYSVYVRNELRKAGKGFKNCLILSDDHVYYRFVDDLAQTMSDEYDAQTNGNVIFYDKGMKYNVLQSMYMKYNSSTNPLNNKLLFVFYNNVLGSVIYNREQNYCYETNSNTSMPKIVFDFYYTLDISTYKTITVEVPENI